MGADSPGEQVTESFSCLALVVTCFKREKLTFHMFIVGEVTYFIQGPWEGTEFIES